MIITRRGARALRWLAVTACIGVAACAPDTPKPVPALAEPPVAPAPIPPVRAQKMMVVAAHPLAAAAGLDVLRRGGSAVDAAIAVQMVLGLVEPQSSGLGGGGFMLFFDPATSHVTAYDGRETAPASADPAMFLTADGKPMAFYDAVLGGRSVGVPGLVRMLELAHREHGRLPWASLFETAIGLAENGFRISARLHGLIRGDKYLATFQETAAYFYRPDGTPRPAGAYLANRAYAETLKAIARDGADAFYTGANAKAIVRRIEKAEGHPGGMTLDDLAGYRAVAREAVCAPYRRWRVCGMPPPSSGGIAILQILGLIEPWDVHAMADEGGEAWHRILEASRLAFADRDAYVADPQAMPVPVAGLLDPAYLAERHRLIRAVDMGPAQPGHPPGLHGAPPPAEAGGTGQSTTHISIVDAEGRAVSMTTSIENAFGARMMVNGYLLNNELTDFAFVPTKDGRAVANAPGAGKRPRSSMAPTLVFDETGRPVMVIGSPGGSRIIGYVAKTLIGVLDGGLDIQAAIDRPNVLNRNGPTEIEHVRATEVLAQGLTDRGHQVIEQTLTSGLHGIVVTPSGVLEGGADLRREGVALGD